MFLGTLRASLLGNMLAGKEVTTTRQRGGGNIKAGKWVIRAGATVASQRRGQNF